MSRLYRDEHIDLLKLASKILYEVKQRRDKQICREHDRDIGQALRSSASDYLKDDNENPV